MQPASAGIKSLTRGLRSTGKQLADRDVAIKIMTGSPALTPWYLARDGQQYGPISDAELAKLDELGYLKPSDLLWRPGFTDWRPAAVVVAPRAKRPDSMPPPLESVGARISGEYRPIAPSEQETGPTRAEAVPLDLEAEDALDAQPQRAGSWLRRTMAVLFFATTLAAAAFYLYPHRTELAKFASTFKFSEKIAAVLGSVDRGSANPPLVGFGDSVEAIDEKLQRSLLWRTAKREFADWYEARVREAAKLRSENQDDRAVAEHMVKSLVELRRLHAPDALSAGLPALKQIAAAFVDNLTRLKQHSIEACYSMITQGESSPLIVNLMRTPEYAGPLLLQLTAIFDAIAEGRKIARVYPAPKRGDYDVLAASLIKRGWSDADLTLFSDAQAFGKAKPEKICQLVHDWFAAQLDLTDAEMQLRLLANALRPLIAG
jgi:GYF domain 2